MGLQHPSFWALGWRSLWRDWRAGELHVLVLAIALAVAALTAVGFFADRLQNGLARDARALIGGDSVLRSDQAPPPRFAQQAQTLGLRTSLQLSFPTMARATDPDGGAARLVSLKAVGEGYPLRGSLRIAQTWTDDVPLSDLPGETTRAIPRPAPCGWMAPCWRHLNSSPVPRCCWATPCCASNG
jgi:putative ABC transport system permease protein